MNKKGLSHVDWVISMGMFILYVMFMLLFIKPGVTSMFKDENLVGIVENNLFEEGYVSIEKIPVYVVLKDLSDGQDPAGSIGPPYNIKVDNFKRVLSSGSNVNNIYVVNSDNESVAHTLSGDDLVITYQKSGSDVVDWSPSLTPVLFWVYYSNNFTYDGVKIVLGDYLTEAGDNVDVSRGTSIKSEGFKEDYLSVLCNDADDYEILKSKWGYPSSREFSYYVVESEEVSYSQNDIIFGCNYLTEPGQQSNVYVKEIRDVFLDNMGNKQGIVINMRTW